MSIKGAIVYSLLVHLLLFAAASLLEVRERWAKGRLITAGIVSYEERGAEEKRQETGSALPEHPPAALRQETRSAPLVSEEGLPRLLPAPQRKKESAPPALSSAAVRGRPSRGAARADPGSGTKICDDFQASIPVFLCNAKIYYGEK